MKIVVYGTGIRAKRFLHEMNEYACEAEIQYFVESKKTKNEFAGKDVKEAIEIKQEDFDYLVIAVEAYEEIKLYLEKNVKDYELFKDRMMSSLLFFEYIDKNSVYNTMPYQSIKLDNGISYITESCDMMCGGVMRATQKNLVESLINVFFELTDIYYGKKERKGIFFDIGANVGTTSIYVKKIINPQLHIIAFEVGKKNYNMFRINCIINDTEDIEIEHIGLGNCNATKRYCYDMVNSGAGFVVDNANEDTRYEEVHITTLDNWWSNNGVCEDVDYIWLDTEGYEANIINGGMGLLQKKRIPLIQEFNPCSYEENGSWELYKSNMQKIYEHFVDAREFENGVRKEYGIEELESFAKKMDENGEKQTDLFFY